VLFIPDTFFVPNPANITLLGTIDKIPSTELLANLIEELHEYGSYVHYLRIQAFFGIIPDRAQADRP